MYANNASQWLQQAVKTIPLSKRNEDIFIKLLDQRRLNYINGTKGADLIDRSNAHLATSTLERGLRLMVVFPDDSAQRAPLLFATALVSQWLARKNLGHSPGNVIYFGTTIGIRQHLSQTCVGSLALDSVFPQFNPSLRAGTKGGRSSSSVIGASDLPQVVCAYSPANAVTLVKEFHPSWIAIDCGKEGRIRWLPELLQHARKFKIPVVAWSHNPLSEAIKDFEQLGDADVIRWPFHLSGNPNLEISPLLVEASDNRFERCLQDAYVLLCKATDHPCSGRLAADALRITWSLQRSLEQLSVPLDLFEAETDNYWGIQRITKLLAGTQRFIDALRTSNRQLSDLLSDAVSFYEKGIQLLRDTEPPFWMALKQLCVEEGPTNSRRIIVFSSTARKQMFALALLARFNIAEKELHEIDIHLVSLSEVGDKILTTESDAASLSDIEEPAKGRSAILIALPSIALSSRISPLLSLGGFDALIYSYQVSALERRVKEWDRAFSVSPVAAEKVISARAGKAPSAASLPRRPTVALGGTRVFSVATGKTAKASTTGPVVVLLDEVAEIRNLLADDDTLDLASISSNVAHQNPDEVVWAQEAIEIRLRGGWAGLFALDDSLNVVTHGAGGERVKEQYVQSLRVGDRILFIHGQKRQSLYKLIISRVHNHPAIETHLALISKWQEELAHSFRAHLTKRWTVEDVLGHIQDKGSSISSPQTVRHWLSGRILAPDDPKDLVRLAETMDLPFVKQYYAQINRAAQRIRGLHRGLSIKLNNWLREQATGGGEAAFEVFDEELGLSFQDFRDSLAILTVEGITKVSGPFLWNSLGTLEQRERA